MNPADHDRPDDPLLADGIDHAEMDLETATFGMGCFWGPDARFGAHPGVIRTRVGYAGGTKSNPAYYALGDHTEVVQIEYDPERLSYGDLLELFWANHNWMSSTRKRQYRGVVLAHDDDQLDAARTSRDALADRTGKSVATAIEPLENFSLAEPSHQKYELRSTPVVGDEFTEQSGEPLVDSTIAARLNGFVAGHGESAHCRAVLAVLDLSPMAIDEIRRRV